MAPRILPILSTLDDIAESIADPPSRRPFAKAVGEAGRRICDRRSANPGAAGYGGALGAAVDTMCGPYWEENDYSPPLSTEPLSPGGQCEGVTYAVGSLGTEVCPAFFQDWSVFVSGVGPVSVSVVSTVDTGQFPRPLLTTFACAFADGTRNLAVRHNTGFLPCIRTYRTDGLPDECGDEPPRVEPGPTPAPDPGPIPPGEDAYDDPETGPMLPIPGLPGIPFRNPFGGGGAGDPPGDPGEPGDSVPADGIGGGAGDSEAEGTAPPGSELVGLRLDLVSVLPNFPEYGDGIYRGGAYIYMGKVSGLDQDFGGSQIRDGQFFYAETPGQTKWRVTANVGISWLVTPFYREVN